MKDVARLKILLDSLYPAVEDDRPPGTETLFDQSIADVALGRGHLSFTVVAKDKRPPL